ncbi:MAG: hypothetical protein ACRC7C_00620, partial [Beijerinckiaceae bacterium]
FAMLEGIIVLAETLKRVRLDWPERQKVKPVQRVTLRPEPGLVMIRGVGCCLSLEGPPTLMQRPTFSSGTHRG